MTERHHLTSLVTIAEHLAETTRCGADRTIASTIMEEFPELPDASNGDIILALAGLVASQGAQCADDNDISRSAGISIVAGAISILAQHIGQEMAGFPTGPLN